jgi:lipopolysaccharide/colanic/teichoic acid biosynthesis glycosyltransferase
MKRTFDLLVACLGLLVASPILLVVAVLIWSYDRQSPFYVSNRVGRNGQSFRMYKLRSMVVNADRSGVTSTGADDKRITPVGHFVRRYKLDELVQLWNVIKGDLSLVGPRPNVPSGVALYTQIEKKLLDVRPGITDIASIVFSDEGDILTPYRDADAAYESLIRPWKNELALIYVDHSSVWLDMRLIYLTALAIVSRPAALVGVGKVLRKMRARQQVIEVAARQKPLRPALPPGLVGPVAVWASEVGD